MKNHLKRIAAPATWDLNRKVNVFSLRPNPGAHSLDRGIALGTLLRDYLHLARTMDEAKKLLARNDILVDGKKRKDHRYMVGLFDTLSLPLLGKQYRMVFDARGKLALAEIDAPESMVKLCKVQSKKMLAGGIVQLNLHDGKNILAQKAASSVNVGDSILLSLPDMQIKEVVALQPGVQVYLTEGKNRGDSGILKEIRGAVAVYSSDSQDTETSAAYIFVIGKEKPLCTLRSVTRSMNAPRTLH